MNKFTIHILKTLFAIVTRFRCKSSAGISLMMMVTFILVGACIKCVFCQPSLLDYARSDCHADRIRSMADENYLMNPLIISSQLVAQNNEGVIRYLVTTNWVKMMQSIDYLSKEQTDRMSYMWGNDAEWKAYTTLYFCDSATKYEDSEEKAEAREETYNWRKSQYYINRDLENRKFKDVMEVLGKVYIVEDTLIYPEWKILNDIKEVAGHVCMNASWTDTLKKQKIIAWFALDMPVSAGPERLCGLPGLILELDINNGAKVISADKIELKELTTELQLPNKIKGKKITEADYRTLLKKHFDIKRKAEQHPYWGIRY